MRFVATKTFEQQSCFMLRRQHRHVRSQAISLVMWCKHVAGKSSPSALASCRLITNSYLVGAAPASAPMARAQSWKATTAPLSTIAASFFASQLVKRMQPCDGVLLTFEGSGVP